ncbi:SAM-dependent methyltransferase [Chondromyces apiculatus]|uniref:Ribosomal RNA large subunit methyltransferase E n=1 Tax=Chondromyces apiculatus DSM 436 TaxID=1192034 RepID=A0A017STN5_9BACT|nr:RlmE family RNA methyltransferase [Chondromyces apiculatus]EYF00358.1 Ribosomal RNA large subunit methyltransferase J [Chondromyces apiculatus DSM 436]
MSSRNKNPYKRPDARTRQAKAQGYPARSVFKLEEIDRRTRLLRAGQRVLDLGAAPGSWSMYTAQRIGPGGKLLAVDLSPIQVSLGPSSKAIQGDALSLDNADLGIFAPYDVVLSDMAPATTGSKLADQARSFDLFMRAVAVAEALLAPGGAFVGKLFMSDDFPKAKAALQKAFAEARVIRPEGTRSVSSEVFLVGLRRKKPEPTPPPSGA